MPINILYGLFTAAIIVLLLLNIVLPLLVPRYRLFWLFRKDEAIRAEEEIDEAVRKRKVAAMKDKADHIKQSGENSDE